MGLVSQIGAEVSDLVAEVHALVTENEQGELLALRVREIKATANAICLHAEQIAAAREQGK